MKDNRVLAIIEEIGDVTTSGAIVNWNLCLLLGPLVRKMDILTLDNVSNNILKNWQYGEIYIHAKENISNFQKLILKVPKVSVLINILLGNDLMHNNRKKNIRKFLKKNRLDYDTLLLLSGGSGFTPHQAINRADFNNFKKIALFHDPYPLTCYPEPYKSSKSIFYFIAKWNLQKCFNRIDFVIFPSQRLYEWYLNDYKIDDFKVKIIPHAVNYNFQTTKNRSLKAKNEILITHTGTLLGPRNPYTFLKVLSSIQITKIKVAFYGNIEKKVLSDIKKIELPEQIFIYSNRIPYTEALQIIHYSDFLLIVEASSKDSPFLPTKFVDYIYSGKLIIALTPSNSEISRLLGESYKLKCELNDEISIKGILTERIFNEEIKKTCIAKLSELKEYFSPEQIQKSYLEIL
jgi:hypothetical protein